jgi:hypothetical protein
LKTISPQRHEAHEDFLNKKFASNGSADFDTFGADASLPLFFLQNAANSEQPNFPAQPDDSATPHYA